MTLPLRGEMPDGISPFLAFGSITLPARIDQSLPNCLLRQS